MKYINLLPKQLFQPKIQFEQHRKRLDASLRIQSFFYVLSDKVYLKYLSNKPLKLVPCLASSFAISCTVS